MGLLDEIQKVNGARRTCRLAAVAEELSKRDREELMSAVADASISARAIVSALKARGHAISEERVHAHRRSSCACVSGE